MESAIKTFSSGEISGGRIEDRYLDKHTGTAYSLVKLDLESFKKGMDMSEQLNPHAKAFVRQRADAQFDELSKEESKHDSR